MQAVQRKVGGAHTDVHQSYPRIVLQKLPVVERIGRHWLFVRRRNIHSTDASLVCNISQYWSLKIWVGDKM
jgi:hypothetical protein